MMKRLLVCLFVGASVWNGVQAQLLEVDPLPAPVLQVAEPDAGEMRLEKLAIRAEVNGLFATVETTMTFFNPNGRDLAGTLEFPLPDGAAVCGYALDINGQLVDGVVVPKEKARVAFETETRRQVDPGLVEHVKGNVYRTRIYPLPANGRRTIRLAYHTPLPMDAAGHGALLLPIPDTEIGELSVNIRAATTAEAPELGGLGDRRFEKAGAFWEVDSGVITNPAPGEAVWVALPEISALETTPDGKTWFVLSDVPVLPEAEPAESIADLFVAWDASGSRLQSNVEKELQALAALAEKGTRIHLLVFRNLPEAVEVFDDSAAALERLKGIAYDGGTDFQALAAAMEADGPWALFTDGVDTLSDAPLDFGGKNIAAFTSAETTDAEALRQACSGRVLDLRTLTPEQAAARFVSPPPAVVGIQGSGVADIQGIGQPASGRIKVLGRLTGDEATLHIRYSDGSLSAPFALRKAEAVPGRLLSTAWAAARIQQLSPRAELYADELLALGRAHGLVSPATSLITLESLDQWVRHEIEPPETLPDMRKQWNDRMANRAKQAGDQHERHMTQIERLWKDRVEWWEKTYPIVIEKVEVPPQGRLAGVEARYVPSRMARASEMMAVEVLEDAGEFEMAEDMELAADFTGFASASMIPMQELAAPAAAPAEMNKSRAPEDRAASRIQIAAWDPDTPYLAALKEAAADQRFAAYLELRKANRQSPAFFLDCADFFFRQGQMPEAIRILTNLAEMQIEDAALLRIFAWRLRQAGELELAARTFRRILRLRGEEPQSHRDLALLLAETGKAKKDPALLEEALKHLHTILHKTWNRHGENTALFALEERNALAAWIERQEWDGAPPQIPALPEGLTQNLDVDIRIVLSWDADATDLDLHVIEPSGEEANYAHNRTLPGGLVSRDVTDGYGPEEYLIRRAPEGAYLIRTKYYGSRRQTLLGPATATISLYTDWGRAAEKADVITVRLDKVSETITLGEVLWGTDAESVLPEAKPDVRGLRIGAEKEEVLRLFNIPADADPVQYIEDTRTLIFFFDDDDLLLQIIEVRPGNLTTILLQ